MRNFETVALHEQLRMRIAVSDRVPPQDSLYDFPTEQMTVYGEQAATSSPWPARTVATHDSDSTSRVISFVLGFALASLIAWLGSIRADRPAATRSTDAVATAVIPVVTGTTEETKDSKGEELTAFASLDAEAPTPVTVPAAVAQTPGDTYSLDIRSGGGTVAVVPASASAPVVAVRTARTQTATAGPAQPKTPSSPASDYRGGLVLSSSPAGAEVTVNGQVVGVTPVVLKDLPVGSRALVVRRDGYSPWSTSVRIVADQQTTVQAQLTPAR
jgi:PEGA domain-containing protein